MIPVEHVENVVDLNNRLKVIGAIHRILEPHERHGEYVVTGAAHPRYIFPNVTAAENWLTQRAQLHQLKDAYATLESVVTTSYTFYNAKSRWQSETIPPDAVGTVAAITTIMDRSLAFHIEWLEQAITKLGRQYESK